jgi:hypothetical protein
MTFWPGAGKGTGTFFTVIHVTVLHVHRGIFQYELQIVFSGQNTVGPMFDCAVRLLIHRRFPSRECYLLLVTNFKPLTYQRGKI